MSNMVKVGSLDLYIKDVECERTGDHKEIEMYDQVHWEGLSFEVGDWEDIKRAIDKLIADDT